MVAIKYFQTVEILQAINKIFNNLNKPSTYLNFLNLSYQIMSQEMTLMEQENLLKKEILFNIAW